MFNQAKFRGGYNLKFISAILFAVTFLIGGFFVANTAQADPVDGGGGGGVDSANLILTVPATTTITRSTLVLETSGVPTGGNTVVDTAIIGLTPIAVTLANTGNTASANVRISPIGASSHIQLWAKDTSGNWFDINVTGYIDSAGKSIPVGSSITTNVYAISDTTGNYPLTVNLVNAVGGANVTSETGIVTVNAPAPATVASVASLSELKAALANPLIATINITADIAAIPETLVVPVGHAVTINGEGHTLTFTGLENVVGNVDDGFMIQAPTTINDLIVDAGLVTPTAWVGTYAIQVYNTTATLNNVTATKGNGGILNNNSVVTLTGAINVSGNGMGGIESTGATASLNVSGVTLFTNASEAYGKPTIWEDGTTGTTVTNYGAITRITKGGQYQYYLTAVVPVTSTSLDSYSVFGKAGVTNDAGGTTHVWGNVGADLMTNITNLIAGQVGGTIIAPAANVQTDASSKYDSLMSATQGTPTILNLAGTHTITPGVYNVEASTLDGALTLNGAGDYIFRSSSSNTIATSGTMNLINGACASNVFWAIPTTMTILGGAHVEGTIIAKTGSITFGTGATLVGQAISLTQQVTLLLNQITQPTCAASTTTARAATFTSTGGTGTHNGITYKGYALTVTADGTSIPLNTADITSMTVLNPGETTATALTVTLDTDPLLWFNVAKATGTYTYTITTANGTVYTATINHTQDAAAAAALALSNAKTAAHGALATAFGTYSSTNYTAENLATLTGIKTVGDLAIDAATNLAGVDTALSTATTGMSGVHTIAQDADIAAATPPTNKDQCKDDGWKIFNNPSFENQGNCVSFVEPSKKGSSGSRPTLAIPATLAVPAVLGASTGPIPGCGNRITGFSVATGESCVGNSTGQVLGAEKFNFTKFLKFKAGSYKVSLQGAEVIELQKLLTSLGYDLGIADGKFGPKTEGAVIKFQIAKGLKGDGIVGALTRAELNK